MFVTDLDNTLVGDDEAMAELNQQLCEHRREHGTKIVYATGRSLISYQKLGDRKQLLDPDALVTSVGTEIYFDGLEETPDRAWSEKLSEAWNREEIVATAAHFADLVPQPESGQGDLKIGYFCTREMAAYIIPQWESLLAERGLKCKLIYSGGQNLDVVPENGDEGMAMQFVRQKWEMPATATVVCGDSGNDIGLFNVPEVRGIMVGNAQPELRQWYEQHGADYHYQLIAACAGGILEGLRYFGLLK